MSVCPDVYLSGWTLKVFFFFSFKFQSDWTINTEVFKVTSVHKVPFFDYCQCICRVCYVRARLTLAFVWFFLRFWALAQVKISALLSTSTPAEPPPPLPPLLLYPALFSFSTVRFSISAYGSGSGLCLFCVFLVFFFLYIYRAALSFIFYFCSTCCCTLYLHLRACFYVLYLLCACVCVAFLSFCLCV